MRFTSLLALVALLVAACSGADPDAAPAPTSAPAIASPTPDLGGTEVAAAIADFVGQRGRDLLAWPTNAASLDPLARSATDAAARFRATQPFGSVAAIDLGFTLTQDAGVVASPGPAGATVEVLQQTLPIGNQHLMGFGSLNPMPAPDTFAWASLDERMAAISRSGSTPVLTLCCAPDWMKGGEPGTTDWTQLAVAPDPEHYQSFADLAAAAVARYPNVRHVVVWNELKGFYDAERNEWDIEAYTELYNLVYAAVKAVDPDVAVGGPYVPMVSWADVATMSHPSPVAGPWGVLDGRAITALEYWLANNVGADFVVIDGGAQTRDAGWIVAPGVATEKFRTVGQWLAARTDLPIWWAELHGLGAIAPTADEPVLALDAQAAVLAASVVEAARGGVDVALLWPATPDDRCHACLWTGVGDDLVASPWAQRLPALRYALGRIDIDTATSPLPGVQLVSSRSGDLVLVINATAESAVVETPLGTASLAPWGQLVLSEAGPEIRHE